jgi:Flp pilus assembly protein TadD
VQTRVIILWLAALSGAWAADSSYPVLEKAYAALRDRQFDEAIRQFQEAVRLAPDRPAIRKDLAYTLLKVGETIAARDHFRRAMELDPADSHVALEYAFLAHETKETIAARRVFDRIRHSGDPASRQTAAQAFENIDLPLRTGIARWKQAVAELPNSYSGHEELAKLAEQRDELVLAAEHFERAWRLKPTIRAFLLDLGRVWKSLGRAEDAFAALLAASRGAEPRVAEAARELLPARYPYVYEFRKALALDESNTELRRELAYLLLEMGNKTEAEDEFRRIVTSAPQDLLSTAQLGFLRINRNDLTGAMPLLDRVLKGDEGELADRVREVLKLPRSLRKRPETPQAARRVEAKELAQRSLEKGYLRDALKYLAIAHETDPLDFEVMLKLGWAHNITRQDQVAVRWFDLARRSPDPKVALEANKAFENLQSARARLQTTFWMFPLFSSRWQDVFAYGQLKTEWKVKGPLRPYFSARFVGDARSGRLDRAQMTAASPMYFSESALIVGLGVATPVYRGLFGWAEAGTALSYIRRSDVPRAMPDYRAGLSLTRFHGPTILNSKPGWFAESGNDAVYMSRFDNNTIFQSQNKLGRNFGGSEDRNTFRTQLFWSMNLNADLKRQYWANTAETGPGVRFRWAAMPPSMLFTVQALRGVHLVNTGNPRRPNYLDIRAGFWYAVTR